VHGDRDPRGRRDQLKAAASKHISGERLEAFVSAANLRAFTSENGDIDEQKVTNYVTTLFPPPASHREWG
jgi:hypothetical protein